jgi:hypothetical protein
MEVFQPGLASPGQAWANQLSPGRPPGPGPVLPSAPAPGCISRLGRPVVRPGWAGRSCLGWANRPPSQLGRLFRPGWASVSPLPGWASAIRFLPAGPASQSRPDRRSRFTPSGLFSSSGIISIVMCQSWDALWLRLAHPPSLYAGLGMPLGSDQHTLHLLVSLILRRRIRLMSWRSRRHTLEDKAKDAQDSQDGTSP